MLPIKTLARNGGLLLRRYSPEILTGIGLVSTGVGTFLACKATYNVHPIVEAENAKIDEVTKRLTDGSIAKDDGTPYTEADKKRDLTVCKANRAKHLALHYLPAGLCLLGGAASILAGHGILRKSQVATAAALGAVEETFRKYRGNVVESLGAEADKMFRFGGQKVVEAIPASTDVETGEVTETKEVTRYHLQPIEHETDPNLIIFDKQHCPETFTGDFTYDIQFLRTRQAESTNRLHINHSITKNEVCDMLGHARTDDGLTHGKIAWDDDDQLGYFVDFGIFDEKGDPYQWVYDIYAEHEMIPIELNFQGSIDGKIARAMRMGGR